MPSLCVTHCDTIRSLLGGRHTVKRCPGQQVATKLDTLRGLDIVGDRNLNPRQTTFLKKSGRRDT